MVSLPLSLSVSLSLLSLSLSLALSRSLSLSLRSLSRRARSRGVPEIDATRGLAAVPDPGRRDDSGRSRDTPVITLGL